MKAPIKISLFIFVTVLLSSCMTGIPITESSPFNNNTYEVSYLFEHDGCKMYRFYDMGHYVYFTNCYGDVTSIVSDSTGTDRVQVLSRNMNPLEQ